MNVATNVFAGRRVDLLGSPNLLQHALVHDRDPITHRHGFDLIVGHVDRGRAEPPLELENLRARLDTQRGVEVRERLVHKEGGRFAHDCAAESDPLALSAGELPRLALEEAVEPEHFCRLLDTTFDLWFRHLLGSQAEGEIAIDGHMRIEGVRLEHHRYVAVARRDVVHDRVTNEDAAA